MLQYNKGNGQILQGLVRRRNAERNLFLSDTNGGDVISCSAGDPVSKAGEFIGDKCSELQNLLICKGNDCGGYGVDGCFGQGTYNSLIQFQRDKGLQVDGLAGEQTFNALRETPQPQQAPVQQVNEVVLQLQRLINQQGFGPVSEDGVAGNETLSHCPIVSEWANGPITQFINLGYVLIRMETLGLEQGMR
jgi:peptidoglycan hydrolase-like protein with peptidoglycan-binding domain